MFSRIMYVHAAVLFVVSAFPMVYRVSQEDELKAFQGHIPEVDTDELLISAVVLKDDDFQPELIKAVLSKRMRKQNKSKLSTEKIVLHHGIHHIIKFKNGTNITEDRPINVEEQADFQEAFEVGSETGCQKVYGHKDTGLVVVNSCPTTWRNGRIRRLCLSNFQMENTDNKYDINSLPVQSDIGINYKNRYCGICNNASKPKQWDIHLICAKPTRLIFHSGQSTVKVMENYRNRSACDLVVKPPYQLPVESCQLRSKRNSQKSYGKHVKAHVDPISFSLLMNFGFDGKTHVMFSTKEEVAEAKSNPKCKENEIFDPDKNRCRHVSCSNGYSLKDDTCINDGKAVVYNDTDLENIRDVNTLTRNNRIALVSLEVNVTYDDLGFVMYALKYKPVIINKLSTLLNITSERIQNFSINFLNQSEASGKNIRVETMTKDEYEKQSNNMDSIDNRIDNLVIRLNANSSTQTNDSSEIGDVSIGFDVSDKVDNNPTTGSDHDVNNAKIEVNASKLSNEILTSTTATVANIVHKKHRILNPQILQLSFILLPSKSDDSKETVSNVINKMNALMKENTFKFNMNGTTFNIVAVDNSVPKEKTTFCKFGIKKVYLDNDFDVVEIYNKKDNTSVTKVYIPSTESLYGPGDYDMTVLVEGKLGMRSNLTGVAGYVFVCINARNVNHDCARIQISSDEYTIFENKTIRFNDQNYNILQYSILDEIRGDLEICVPDEYYKNEELRRSHRWFVQGCHIGFSKFTRAEGYITAIVGRLSIFALSSVIITYWLFKTLRNLPGINTMNLTLALLIGEAMFIEGETSSTPWVCAFVAISVHYFFLASFFWMNVMSFDVYKTFANKCILTRIRNTRKYLPRYAVYAWGSPAIIVAMCVFIEYGNVFGSLKIGYGRNMDDEDINITEIVNSTNGNYTEVSSIQNNSGCWIRSPVAALIAFGLPVMLICVINSVFFIRTIICIQATAKLAHHTTRRTFSNMTGKSDVMLYVRMSTVMGFTWIFGFASSIISSIFTKPNQSVCMSLRILSILFTIFNCGQGMFIFFAFVFKRRVFYLYKGLFKRIRIYIEKRRFKKLYATSSNTITTVTSRVSNIPD